MKFDKELYNKKLADILQSMDELQQIAIFSWSTPHFWSLQSIKDNLKEMHSREDQDTAEFFAGREVLFAIEDGYLYAISPESRDVAENKKVTFKQLHQDSPSLFRQVSIFDEEKDEVNQMLRDFIKSHSDFENQIYEFVVARNRKFYEEQCKN